MLIRPHATLADLRPGPPLALAIGAFDGLHLGHRAVLREVARLAGERQLRRAVLTFSGLAKDGGRSLLGREHRDRLLAEAGVEELHVLAFGPDLRDLTAGDFLSGVLLGRLGVRALALGAGARLGRGRATDAASFLELASRAGLATALVPHVEVDGAAVSTSRVKALVAEGGFAAAGTLLGRPYTLAGRVQAGRRQGTELGFPTANLAAENLVLPPFGVYAAEVSLDDGPPRPAAAFLSRRRGLEAGRELLLEAHIPGVSGDLYGRWLAMRLLRFIRAPLVFTDAGELRRRIALDVEEASGPGRG